MKKIYWELISGKSIVFKVNWLEFIILKRIFKKQKYEILEKNQIKGNKLDLVVHDEWGIIR